MLIESLGLNVTEIDPAFLGKRREFEMVIEHPQMVQAALLINNDPEKFKAAGGIFKAVSFSQTVLIHEPNGEKVVADVVINQLEFDEMTPKGGAKIFVSGTGVMTIHKKIAIHDEDDQVWSWIKQ